MLWLGLAALAFIGTHIGVSGSPLRNVLVSRLGTGPYQGLYSLVAVVTLLGLVFSYNDAPRTTLFWYPAPWHYLVAKVLVFPAFLLVVGGLFMRNPTNVGMSPDPDGTLPALLQITRHPVQWGIMMWAASHLLANGDSASVLFFGAFLAVSAPGTVLMDRRKRATADPAWTQFFARTSNVPFAAIVAGRGQLKPGELNVWVLVGGGVLYAGVYAGHQWIAGMPLM